MSRRSFRTVTADLLDVAESSRTYFEEYGYRVNIEKAGLGYPYTPTMLASRASTTLIIEVQPRPQLSKLRKWVGFARSSAKDFRVAVCVPPSSPLTPPDEQELRALGVGCFTSSERGVTETIPPMDLGISLILPELPSMPKRVRALLAPAYEQFRRSEWREGFDTACQVFEEEARRYLNRHIRSSRIEIMTAKGPVRPPASEVNRLTMGQLAGLFSRIQSKNIHDSNIQKTLQTLNKDRIRVVHHRSKAVTERRLRANVGRYMWIIAAAMRDVIT